MLPFCLGSTASFFTFQLGTRKERSRHKYRYLTILEVFTIIRAMETKANILRARLTNNGYTLLEDGITFMKKRYTGAMTLVRVSVGVYSVGITRRIYTTRGFMVSEISLNSAEYSIQEIESSIS